MLLRAAIFEFELRGLPFFEVFAWNIALLKECRFLSVRNSINIALLRSELQKLLSSDHVHTQSPIKQP